MASDEAGSRNPHIRIHGLMDGPAQSFRPRAISSAIRVSSQAVIAPVANALDILGAFDYEHDELGVAELARKLGLHKNNVFRLLATLLTRGYIEQEEHSRNYRLGLKIFEVGNVFLGHLGIPRKARPILEELASRCNETAYLTVLDGPDVVYISMHETTHPMRVAPRLGLRLPAYCTAAGKCLLAFESRDKLDEMFREYPFRRLTENTITRHEDLLDQLKEIAKQGYALDNEEWECGVKCVAAPVRDYAHRIVAAMVVSGPTARFLPERIQVELLPLALEEAARLSQRLGYEFSHTPETGKAVSHSHSSDNPLRSKTGGEASSERRSLSGREHRSPADPVRVDPNVRMLAPR